MRGEILLRAVGTRTVIQCLDRMREKSTKEFVASLLLSPPSRVQPNAVHSGRWDEPEVRRLESAINQLGSCSQFAELAAILGNRTSFQVSVKINDLLKAGKLRQAGQGSFTITK